MSGNEHEKFIERQQSKERLGQVRSGQVRSGQINFYFILFIQNKKYQI
jgi:hypothetical protein